MNPLRRQLLLLPLALSSDIVRADVAYPDVQAGVPLAFRPFELLKLRQAAERADFFRPPPELLHRADLANAFRRFQR